MASAHFCTFCGYSADTSPTLGSLRALPKTPVADVDWIDIKQAGSLFVIILAIDLMWAFAGESRHDPLLLEYALAAQTAVVAGFASYDAPMIAPLFRLPPISRATLTVFAGVSILMFLMLSGYFALYERIFSVAKASASMTRAHWPLSTIVIVICIAPPLIEETAFRGVIQTRLERVIGTRQALIVQAGLFSLMHLTPLIFVSHFFLGLCFGTLRNRTRSIYPGMLLHGLWNGWVLFKELH